MLGCVDTILAISACWELESPTIVFELGGMSSASFRCSLDRFFEDWRGLVSSPGGEIGRDIRRTSIVSRLHYNFAKACSSRISHGEMNGDGWSRDRQSRLCTALSRCHVLSLRFLNLPLDVQKVSNLGLLAVSPFTILRNVASAHVPHYWWMRLFCHV
jgi:hypothetical protein